MKRLLIANRGEIALRILRAAHSLGIETVVVYTAADRNLGYLSLANQAVCIGLHSYLDQQQLLAAATSFRCDSVHPGYGFLSENAEFAAAVLEVGLQFVGPLPAHIALMGNKSRARQFMRDEGVTVLPGSEVELDSAAQAASVADEIGYPVMLKASHGGGGRGIVIADSRAVVMAGFDEIRAESQNLFGDGSIYLEKHLLHPRHIELQVFGDGEGEVRYLGARDCSVQRRHQKLIEEAPPSGIEPATLTQLAAASIEALQRLGYRGAGTIEFLLEQGEFFFIEMNTRIQVEHPVTECLTGLDLIALQLRLAAGDCDLAELTFEPRGHAIECRINAEDQQYRPSPGRIDRLRFPGGPGVRVDSHVYEGYEVPHRYDSLIGKLIVHGSDRAQALRRLRQALAETEIGPIQTNIQLHRRILEDEHFLGGNYGTDLLRERGAQWTG